MNQSFEKRNATRIYEGGNVVKDFWGRKRLSSYTKEKGTLFDSYVMGWCKSFRDRIKRIDKKGKRQQLQQELKERINELG